jgi:hypothetical protein
MSFKKPFQNNSINIPVVKTIFSQDMFDLIKNTVIEENGEIHMKDAELKEIISRSYEYYMWQYTRGEVQSNLLLKTNIKLYGKYYYKYNKYMNSVNDSGSDILNNCISSATIPQFKKDIEIIREIIAKIFQSVFARESYYKQSLKYWSTIEKEAMEQSTKRKYNGNANFWMGEIGKGALFLTPRKGTY